MDRFTKNESRAWNHSEQYHDCREMGLALSGRSQVVLEASFEEVGYLQTNISATCTERSFRLRTMWGEYQSLSTFIDAEVEQRKAVIDEALTNGGSDAIDSVNQDIFSRLVLASQSDGKQSLSNRELVIMPL